jgi:hypothetical protein
VFVLFVDELGHIHLKSPKSFVDTSIPGRVVNRFEIESKGVSSRDQMQSEYFKSVDIELNARKGSPIVIFALKQEVGRKTDSFTVI